MLARCGALYHDIGKLRRPNFFKENQVGMENPHDQIDACLLYTSLGREKGGDGNLPEA